jgi:protein gp37
MVRLGVQEAQLMQKTGIEWCDSTWNPVTGCLNGCKYCYAKKIANRFGGGGHSNGEYHMEITDDGFPLHCIYNKQSTPYPFGFSPTFHRYRLDEPQKHKKGQRIFVCSMADLFGPWVPDDWIVSVFEACKKAPQHKYMFLTKFPKRYVELAWKGLLPKLDNFWYGQSASDGTVKAFFGPYYQFLSAEPLFGIVNPWGFDLVIIGAETGNRKAKIIPDKRMVDVTTIASMCPVFMKDSLVPIVGEDHMLRQMPEGLIIKENN